MAEILCLPCPSSAVICRPWLCSIQLFSFYYSFTLQSHKPYYDGFTIAIYLEILGREKEVRGELGNTPE